MSVGSGGLSRMVIDRQGTLLGEDFSRKRLDQFSSVGTRFESCDFSRSVIKDCGFGNGMSMSEYVRCTFDGARLTPGPGGYARFEGCSFLDVTIKDWFCFAVEIEDCTFSGRMEKAFFNGTVRQDLVQDAGRTHNAFRGNDFSQMDLFDVDFRTGIDLSLQKLPQGPEYDYIPDAKDAVRRSRSRLLGFEGDRELRRLAFVLLDLFGNDVAQGQQQLFVRENSYPKNLRPAVRLVLDNMRE